MARWPGRSTSVTCTPLTGGRPGPGGGLCGFLEAALRSRADGCEARPVGYIEGWYVDPDMRRRGVGRAQVEEAEAWAPARGCRQMASDAELWNEVSHQAHGALGYEETARLVLIQEGSGSGGVAWPATGDQWSPTRGGPLNVISPGQAA
jgi:GNAT superfamily N-acetyltransferase